jgi:PAS domain S-box-containing protein
LTSLRLLLIDDDEDSFVLVRDFIADTAPDWTVTWASTYEAGIDGLANGRYDAALLDYRLGAHTGLELLTSVRDIDHLPPIVLLTGQGDLTINLAAMATGAADYLDKEAMSPALLERTIRQAIERDRVAAALRASEARYRGLFEGAGDAVLIADENGHYVDANPAACALLGVAREDAIGRSLFDFVVPSDDLPDSGDAWAAFLLAGTMRGHVRILRPDGTVRDADFVATANFTPGRHLSVLRDNTEQLAAKTALVDAVSSLRLSDTRFRVALDGVALHAVILDTTGHILFANRHLLARTGWSAEDIIGADVFTLLAPEEAPDAIRVEYQDNMTSDTFLEHVESTWRTRSGGRVLIAWTNSPILDEAGQVVAVASVGEDVTARREAESTQAQLVAAIEQAAESIVVTDVNGRVTYTNSAFERTSGYDRAEVMGREPRTVLRGTGVAHAYPRLGPGFQAGRPWSDECDVKRRDGTGYREEVTISPVHDQTGTIVNFVRVGRDVTQLRSIQESLDLTTRERVAFAHALSRLQPRDTPEEAGQEITDAVVELPGIDMAFLMSFEEEGDVRVLGLSAPAGHPFTVGSTVSSEFGAYLRARASTGAWTESRGDTRTETHRDTWNALGLEGVVYAPIGNDEGLIGVMGIGTLDAKVAARIESQLPAATEFAAAAQNLLVGPLATRRRVRVSRRRVQRIIETGSFNTVFQPIVDLATGDAIGFEGLTRFEDGSRPDLVFAEASTSGTGLDLEAATLERTISASAGLPAGPWLSLNVSAALILERERLARILVRRTRPIVLEITEHDVIADYLAVRATVPLLGPDVRLAVDDAGAGVANFTHIVELRPDFVKIDIGLVRGVNHDLTRQALIVGLRHFARATNGWLIAEGVETEEERQTLIGLGLNLGQGYLFGRPAEVHAWTVPAASRSPRRLALAVGQPAGARPPVTVPG